MRYIAHRILTISLYNNYILPTPPLRHQVFQGTLSHGGAVMAGDRVLRRIEAVYDAKEDGRHEAEAQVPRIEIYIYMYSYIYTYIDLCLSLSYYRIHTYIYI